MTVPFMSPARSLQKESTPPLPPVPSNRVRRGVVMHLVEQRERRREERGGERRLSSNITVIVTWLLPGNYNVIII